MAGESTWRKSTYSGATGDCVEAGCGPGVIAVRDSKLPGSPVLEVPAAAWARFIAAVKAGAA